MIFMCVEHTPHYIFTQNHIKRPPMLKYIRVVMENKISFEIQLKCNFCITITDVVLEKVFLIPSKIFYITFFVVILLILDYDHIEKINECFIFFHTALVLIWFCGFCFFSSLFNFVSPIPEQNLSFTRIFYSSTGVLQMHTGFTGSKEKIQIIKKKRDR